jgi:RHS repeat-associated protein
VGSAEGAPGHGPTTFYPYGEQKSGTTSEQYDFATYWEDSESGLNYAMNRYYSSTLGRFLSPDQAQSSADPKSPQSFNLYPYVQNDPVNFNDAAGQTPIAAACSVFWGPAQTVDPYDMPSEYGNLFYNTSGTLNCVYVSVPTVKPVFPKCNKYGINDVLFIWNNWGNAENLSNATGVPADWILAWAAAESGSATGAGYGQSGAAVDNQNYFGQRTTDWPGSTPCPTGVRPAPIPGWACFANFFASAQSALETMHSNPNWTFQGTNPISAAQILTAFSSGQVAGGIAAAFQAVGNGQDHGNASYGQNVADALPNVDAAINCLKPNYGWGMH